jgi:glycosyltransferase involved in cell wall biosynthesis
MTDDALSVTLVIPAYNEASRLRTEPFAAALGDFSWLTMLFVDDGSSDATVAVLREFAQAHPGRVEVLVLAKNGGKAEAVRRGLLAAAERGSDAIGFCDADLSAPLVEVARLRAELLGHPDLWATIGSRIRLLGRAVERSAVRHYLGRVFATAASVTLNLPVYDTQCGLKLFRNLPQIRGTLTEPFASRWIFDVELLARVASMAGNPAAHHRIREVPLEEWVAAPGSRLRLRDFLAAPWELLRIQRRYRRSP